MAVDITLEDLTNGSLVSNEWTGTGVFDKLMVAVNENLEGQYQKNRIKGTDYANVYLGSIQSVISQSIEFLLREKKTEYELLAITAKVEDENGKIIDANGNLTNSTDPETQHHWAVKNAEESYNKAIHETTAAENQAVSVEWDGYLKQGKMAMEYNLDVDAVDINKATLSEYAPIAPLVSQTFNSVAEWKENAIPKTIFEMQALKGRVESDVGNNTALGYKADTYYKTYRSLQELMFALANSGIINQDNADAISGVGSVYSRITQAMEKSMNKQAAVWGDSGYVDLDGDGSNEG